MTEHPHDDEEALRDNARALFATDHPADPDAESAEGAEQPKPGYVAREGHPAGPPTPDDDRAFVRELFATDN